jgi:hypothetical protein
VKLPSRRRSRPRGRARLALAGDFPDTGESVTEVLQRVRPPDYDGRTYQFTGASGPGLPGDGIYAAPPRVHQAAGRGWAMTVDTAAPPIPMDTRLRRARGFLDLKVAYLKARGMGYRIDDAEQVLQRGEDLPAGSVMADTHAEAVTHLLGNRGEWEPAGGWDHGWAEGLHWYDPEVREPWWDAPATRGTS